MFIHLGNNILINSRDIVGIFDIENTTTGKNTSRLLENATREKRVITVSYEMPKSFVVCIEKGKEIVYISQISAATLRKRAAGKG
ncbi:MAG: extracellular matrix regulator RemB [Porcipelethomonas sp.]